MNGQGGILGRREHDLQLASMDSFGDMVGVETGEAEPGNCRASCRLNGVDRDTRAEVHCSRRSGSGGRREAPAVGAEVGEGNDLVRRDIPRLGERRCRSQIGRRANHNAPDVAADAGRDKRGIGQVANP